MALENLQTVFNNIYENKENMIDDQPSPSIDTIGGDHSYGSGQTFDSINNVLQPDGTYQPYGNIPINASAEDSPMSRKLILSEAQPSVKYYSGYENQKGVTILGDKVYEGLTPIIPEGEEGESIRFRHDDGANIGKDNALGRTKYTLESIFDPTHGSSQPQGRPAGIGDTSNLDIRESHQDPWRIGRKPKNSREPYIVKPIPKDSKYRGWYNRYTDPIDAVTDDFQRFGTFYSSIEGIESIKRENITNALIGDQEFFSLPPQPFASLMAPPFPFKMTGFLNARQQAIQGSGLGSIRKPLKVQYSKRSTLGLPFAVLGDTAIGQKEFKKANDQIAEQPVGGSEVQKKKTDIIKKGFKFLVKTIKKSLEEDKRFQYPIMGKPTPFIDLSGGVKDTEYKDAIASSGIELPPEAPYDDLPPLEIDLTDPIQTGDFYVRFKDLRVNEFIYFRGYVTGINENITPSWNSTQYIGRSEDVYIYQKAERDLSFNLKVYPANAIQFETMYQKLDRLTSLAYPSYEAETSTNVLGLQVANDSMIRMKPPFTELYMAHIGDHVKGQFGFIKSLTYTVPEGGDWDAITALPRMFDIAISYQILGKRPPQLGKTKFYRSGGYVARSVTPPPPVEVPPFTPPDLGPPNIPPLDNIAGGSDSLA